MKALVKQFLDRKISRSRLLQGLSAIGLSAAAASTIAESLAPTRTSAATAASVRTVTDTGAVLLIQQLKAAGVTYYFFNPSSPDAALFNAIAKEPSIQLIKGLQEGVVVAMADGYARLSGKTGVCSVAGIGLPAAMAQLVNTYKDRIPLILITGGFSQPRLGRDGYQDYDHQETMLEPMTKWYWNCQTTGSVPENTRRALRFASTPPSGPVYLTIPENVLESVATAQIIDETLFDGGIRVRPGAADIERVARMLIEAKNPLLSVGDEITTCSGEAEVLELAELLGLPVVDSAWNGQWSKPFPTANSLYVGPVLQTMRFPGDVDVWLNIGSSQGELPSPGRTLISIRNDPTNLGRVSALDIGFIADSKLAAADLVAAIKSLATTDRLRKIAEDRSARIRAFTSDKATIRAAMLNDFHDAGNGPIRLERLAVELENALDPDTIYVNDVDSGKKMDPFMTFGGKGKIYVGTGPQVLGWGTSAGTGAKLARPDNPVVAILGDGAFLFGGPQPLWTQARYKVPVTNIVLNNLSYNNERNRIWAWVGGEQFDTGADQTCYNGSPDVDFAKASEAFGVEAETVEEPAKIKAALLRAKRANIEGRPYLLNMIIQRDGLGAASTWYPEFSLADARKRKV